MYDPSTGMKNPEMDFEKTNHGEEIKFYMCSILPLETNVTTMVAWIHCISRMLTTEPILVSRS